MSSRKYLTKNEIGQILSATVHSQHPERDYCLINMCFIHGFRVSEACQLKLSDIDLVDCVINIRRLKNGLSTVHPLIKSEIQSLCRWLEVRKNWNKRGDEWLFPSQKGGPLSRSRVYRMLKWYGKLAGINIAPHPHMLRHACGYALADLGIDTRLIQDYLGHRNIRHTVIYTASNAGRFSGIWEDFIKG